MHMGQGTSHVVFRGTLMEKPELAAITELTCLQENFESVVLIDSE